eukprot:444150_1
MFVKSESIECLSFLENPSIYMSNSSVKTERKQYSHTDLVVFGYLREIYEEKYDKSIPSVIKLLCCDYFGYGICCFAFTKEMNELQLSSGNHKMQKKNIKILKRLHTLYDKPLYIHSTEALFASIYAKHMKCFNHLQPKTINPTLNGNAPLKIAFVAGNIECIQKLIQTDTTLRDKADNEGRTLLWYSSFYGYFNIVKLIINSLHENESNININQIDNKGFFPLFVAAQNNHANVVQLLLQNNANINQIERNGHAPLYIASLRGHIDVVKILLLDSNIDINLADNENISPLWAACQNNHSKVVELLLNPSILSLYDTNIMSANPNLRKFDGCTPLYITAQQGNIECMKLLVKSKANVDLSDNEGATPLFVACQNDNKEAVEILLFAKADFRITRNTDGTTPFIIAAHNGNVEIVHILLKYGANCMYKNDTNATALCFAALRGHLDCLKLLYEYLLNSQPEQDVVDFVNGCDDNGHAAFHYSCTGGFEDVIKYMLNTMKVNIWMRDNENRTGLDLAQENQHQSVVSLLSTLYTEKPKNH